MLSKDYEWFGAMGLMITLIWLYTEILRLLAKLNSRDQNLKDITKNRNFERGYDFFI